MRRIVSRPAPVLEEAPRRMIRRTPSSVTSTVTGRTSSRSTHTSNTPQSALDTKGLKKALQLAAILDGEIAELNQQIAAREAQRDTHRATVARILHDANETQWTDTSIGYIAEIVDKMSKASIDIDPKVLQESLKRMRKGDEFWNVIKVGVVELRKVLTETEIKKIGTVTEAKKVGSEVVIRSLADTKKKRK